MAKGDPKRPMSKSEIEGKFDYMSAKLLNKQTRQKIIGLINGLESVEDVAELFPLLSRTSSA